MNLLAFGDSFTWGTELADCTDNQYSLKTYSALLSNRFQGYKCFGLPGNSNHGISRSVIENYSPADFYMISWTYTTRFDFYFESDGWKSVTPHTNSQMSFIDSFYKYTGSNAEYQLANSLQQIILAQQYLNQIKANYLFVLAEKSLLETVEMPYLNNLRKMIDWKKWFMFPSAVNTATGFIDWAKENNFKFGQKHPLEMAHHQAAKLLEAKINELVT
jgi:hypothetical protein